MGLCGTSDGMSVQFCNADGTLDGTPFYGKYARIIGRDQQKIIDESGTAQSADETAHPGSKDWLTLVAVADSEEKLKEILRGSGVGGNCPNTSASSRRARVEIHLGGIRGTFKDRLLIASGPIVKLHCPDDIKIHCVHVKVLPPGIRIEELDKDNPLRVEFDGSAVALQGNKRP